MKTLQKYLILITIGGILYYFLEIISRGYSHPSMIIVGGICFIVLDSINEILKWSTPLTIQTVIGAIAITIIEFISGIIINIVLKLNVWDYSNLPFNIMGQVCPQFFLVWLLIAPVGIILGDYLRYYLLKEEKPRYKLF